MQSVLPYVTKLVGRTYGKLNFWLGRHIFTNVFQIASCVWLPCQSYWYAPGAGPQAREIATFDHIKRRLANVNNANASKIARKIFDNEGALDLADDIFKHLLNNWSAIRIRLQTNDQIDNYQKTIKGLQVFVENHATILRRVQRFWQKYDKALNEMIELLYSYNMEMDDENINLTNIEKDKNNLFKFCYITNLSSAQIKWQTN